MTDVVLSRCIAYRYCLHCTVYGMHARVADLPYSDASIHFVGGRIPPPSQTARKTPVMVVMATPISRTVKAHCFFMLRRSLMKAMARSKAGAMAAGRQSGPGEHGRGPTAADQGELHVEL